MAVRWRKQWVDPLLRSVNLGGRRLEVSYLDWEDLVSAELGSEEQRVFQQLHAGTSVVGSLISAQDEFYFLVVQPVERNREMVGAVQAKVSADLLSQQGHARCCSTMCRG